LLEAANSFNDIELCYRLEQLYVDEEEWSKAINKLNKVVLNHKFSNIADTYLLLGIVAYEYKDNIASFKALNKTLGYDKTKQQAKQWLTLLKIWC